MEAQIVSVLPGVTLDYLDRLPAADVPAYGIVACEREALTIDRMATMFLVPVEAFGGHGEIRKQLSAESRRLRGIGGLDERTKVFLARQAELVEQLNAAASAEDFDLMARLEARYQAEMSEHAKEELDEIRAGLNESTVTASPAVVAAMKRWVA